MEIIEEVFPKDDCEQGKIILFESNVAFVFKNCPHTTVVKSRNVEIPEIGAVWWIEISEWSTTSSSASRSVSLKMKWEKSAISTDKSLIHGRFDLKVEIPESMIHPITNKSILTGEETFTLGEQNKHSKELKRIFYLTNSSEGCIVVKSRDNDYRFECRLKIFMKTPKPGQVSLNFANSHTHKKFGQLMDSLDFSDFTFIVSGQEFKVHRNILSLASPYFETLFKSEFKESEKNILVNAENPVIFQHLLEFIYKGKFPNNFPEIAMDVYKMAHLYQIDDLKTMSLHHITSQEINRENALKIYQFASEYEIQDLFEMSWMFIRCNILQLSKPKPFDRDPFTIEEIEEFVKINEDYEKKVEKFYLPKD